MVEPAHFYFCSHGLLTCEHWQMSTTCYQSNTVNSIAQIQGSTKHPLREKASVSGPILPGSSVDTSVDFSQRCPRLCMVCGFLRPSHSLPSGLCLQPLPTKIMVHPSSLVVNRGRALFQEQGVRHPATPSRRVSCCKDAAPILALPHPGVGSCREPAD
jgi:hypothetical protein